jgi:small subunit ribosomal protein S5e
MAEVEEQVVAPAAGAEEEEEEEEIAVGAGGGGAEEEEFVPAGGVEIKLYGKWSFDDIEVRDISLVVRTVFLL